ncbi:hypothetical protein [Marivivens donghaensis]|uniref:GREB1-related protein n=1 Tax=Marivivens donghaensis TaxID=1699413 RepID=UPI00201EB6D5|nr:hypothetical protein [Marivivens donghaensis]MCL7409444.1 hypothetical protein [Marivivens donghaensis]MDN3702923.1 hypothetical protein [Marivivens donghaensis]
MERIFIPTVNRPKQQITYEHLPPHLQKRVTLVVQEWEQNNYNYDCDYLVLPSEINLGDRLCLAKTRAHIYRTARNEKYAVLDDDIVFKRRNSKRFTGNSNMATSSRQATDDDLTEMFELFSQWLDEKNVTLCGASQVQNIPATQAYRNNASLSSAIWVNGSDFSDVLDDLPLTEVKYGEDTLFFLSLLTRGFGNRVSQEFCFENKSLGKDLQQSLWDSATHDEVWRDHQRIQELLPDFFKVLLDAEGNRVPGGFRNYGKVRTYWSKAFKQSQVPLKAATNKFGSVKKTVQSNPVEVSKMTFNLSDFSIPGDNQVTISSKLEAELKSHFHTDRRNRFRLYVLSSGIRRKYLDENAQKYTDEFLKWYDKAGMKKLFGSIANFTKYASAGDVISYVASETSDPEKYLNQLPVSVGALYEISMILKASEETFKLCLQFTASRKTIDEPKFDWKTKKPALIGPRVTEQTVRTWRQKWENPPPPKAKRTDKRTLPLLTIYCSGELLDFDRKTGDKIGCLDLEQVEQFLQLVSAHFGEGNSAQFRFESKMDDLTKMYFKRKEYYDVTRNAVKGRKDTSGRYV